MFEIESVEIARVTFGEGRRPLDAGRVAELAESIVANGMLQPIGVTRWGGGWIGVWGRHRLEAARSLGWLEIEARVVELDPTHAEMAELAENLHRTELDRGERDRALARYVALYDEIHPGAAAAAAAKGWSNLKEGKKAPAARDKAPVAGPSAAVAKALGVGQRAVQRAVKRAHSFTPDERAVLDAVGLTDTAVDRVAAVEDPSDRLQVVTLIGSGLSYQDSMREVLGDAFVDDGDDGVSDDEFLAACPIRPRVNRGQFDADALLYKAARKARVVFSRAVAWEKHKGEISEKGPYFRRLAMLLDCKHPRDWVLCHECDKGRAKGGVCNRCRGAGYVVG